MAKPVQLRVTVETEKMWLRDLHSFFYLKNAFGWIFFICNADSTATAKLQSLPCRVSNYHVSVETLATSHTETHHDGSWTYLGSDIQMKQPIWMLMVNLALLPPACDRHCHFPHALSACKIYGLSQTLQPGVSGQEGSCQTKEEAVKMVQDATSPRWKYQCGCWPWLMD